MMAALSRRGRPPPASAFSLADEAARARRAERNRCEAIIKPALATPFRDVAAHLAFHTSLAPKRALTVLAAAGADLRSHPSIAPGGGAPP